MKGFSDSHAGQREQTHRGRAMAPPRRKPLWVISQILRAVSLLGDAASSQHTKASFVGQTDHNILLLLNNRRLWSKHGRDVELLLAICWLRSFLLQRLWWRPVIRLIALDTNGIARLGSEAEVSTHYAPYFHREATYLDIAFAVRGAPRVGYQK